MMGKAISTARRKISAMVAETVVIDESKISYPVL
jgi:hypothetical protein